MCFLKYNYQAYNNTIGIPIIISVAIPTII